MKSTLLAVLLVIVALHPFPEQAGQANNGHDNAQVEPSTAAIYQPPLARPSAPKEENSTNGKTNEPIWCERLLKPLVDNWPLLIVTVWGIIVAIYTLGPIKKSADAALLNAQAFINSERPWIVVTMIPDKEKEGLFWFRATNKGRTPANIVVAGCYCEVEFFPRGPIDGPPIPPAYEHSIDCPPENLIMPDEGFNINHGVNPESVIDSNSKRQAVTEPREWLCVYGQIAYRDVFTEPSGEPHHTRWFYSYNVDKKQMKPSGPNAYSEKK